MCGCFVLLLGAVAPRFALSLMALFNNEITRAFNGSWIVPLIGWFLLPYTTLVFVLSPGGRSASVTGFNGSSWPWLRRRPRLVQRRIQQALGNAAVLIHLSCLRPTGEPGCRRDLHGQRSRAAPCAAFDQQAMTA